MGDKRSTTGYTLVRYEAKSSETCQKRHSYKRKNAFRKHGGVLAVSSLSLREDGAGLSGPMRPVGEAYATGTHAGRPLITL